MARQFSPLISKLVMIHNAWIVGSAADPSADLSTCRDIDVVVPFSEWGKAAQLIPTDAVVNSFGGWKVPGNPSTDVWPDSLDTILNNAVTKYIWHPRSGNRWVKI